MQSEDDLPLSAVALQQTLSPSQAVRRDGNGGGNQSQRVYPCHGHGGCLGLSSSWKRGQLHLRLVHSQFDAD